MYLRYLRCAIRRALRRTLCAPASAITDANAPRPMFPATGNGPAPGQYSATCAALSPARRHAGDQDGQRPTIEYLLQEAGYRDITVARDLAGLNRIASARAQAFRYVHFQNCHFFFVSESSGMLLPQPPHFTLPMAVGYIERTPKSRLALQCGHVTVMTPSSFFLYS